MESVLVITNAEAGSSDQDTLDQALAVLGEFGRVESIGTSSAAELDRALATAADRWIVVAGGDGSLHAVVQTLHDRDDLAGRVIGLLPLGTGNDFARGAGIPLDATEAARLIGTGTPRGVDLIVDSEDQVVVNNVHVGAGAAASRRGAVWKKRLGRFGIGKAGYPIGAAIAGMEDSHIVVEASVDDHPVTRGHDRVLMVAVGIGSSVGGGTELTPEARVDDGRLDVMVSFATHGWAKLGYVRDLVRRRHHHRDDVLYRRGSSVRVSVAADSDPFWISADGEITGPHRNREWHLLASAYSMVLPTSGADKR